MEEVTIFDCPLQIAVQDNDLKTIKYFIEKQGINYNVKTHDGYDLLQLAVQNNALEALQYLIEVNRGYVDHKFKGHFQLNLLQLAALCGSKRVLEYLINEKNFDYNVKDENGYNLLQLAVESNSKKVLVYLIEERNFNYQLKNDGGYNLLQLAAQHGSLEALQFLMKVCGKHFNCKGKDNYQYSLLRLAVKGNKLDVVEFLVTEEEIDVDVADAQGYTLLHLAAENGHLGIVQALVKEGANISIRNNRGETPIKVASNDTISRFLRKKENEYNTSLLDNAKGGNLDEIKSLLSIGANVNAKTSYQFFTALHFAAKFDHCKLVEFLVKKEGIEINAKTTSEWTPLHLATFFCRPRIVQLLLGSRADVTVKDSHQRTPLDLVEELLATNPEDENFKAIKDLLLNTRDQRIQSSKKPQESLLHLSEYINGHFHDIELRAVEQGLYLPSFKEREVETNGRCVAVTRGLSQALFLQSDESFLSKLENSAKVYERIAQGKQVSEREKEEIFALSKLLDDFDQQLDSSTNSLPSNLIRAKGYKTLGDLSNYIARVKGDFAIHLVTSDHVVAIYRTGNNYAYFDCNTAFVSGLKNVDQLMQIVEKGVEFAGYKIEEKGFLVEHFNVEEANKLLSSGDKQILAKEIKIERQLLAEQDKELGFIKINGQELSRVQLYDFGTKVNVEGSVPLLINADMNLSSEKFQDLIDKEEVGMTAREYLENLKNGKNVEEVVQATKFIPFIGSKREIEEAKQTRKPKQSLLELAKGIINCILAAVSLTSASWSESQLSEKADDKPRTCLNDPTVDKQLQRSCQTISS